MKSINPYNNEVLNEYEVHWEDDIESIIERADDGFQQWKGTDFALRSRLMRQCASVLREGKDKYGRIMTLEMGKVFKEAVSEVEKCALACDYYAENAEMFLADEKLDAPEGDAFISYYPLGVVLAIMPWNFPFWQVFRFAAPNIMAGNVGLLKHASNVPQCALALEEIFRKAGFPEGVFQTLLIESDKVNRVIDDERVHAVTITGSEGAGSKVAERAGKNIKKTVLELGGSDPFIVLGDADLDIAATVAVKSRMVNFGQSCIAAKRFIVEVSVAEDFLEKFKSKMEALKFGDPFDEGTDYSAMAREDLAEGLLKQVEDSIKLGAHVILGGDRPNKKGAFFNPTILTNIRPGMPACDEELFGPVATVIVVEDEEEAIKIANKSRYGLGGSVWTRDVERGKAVARRVQSGAVYVNKMMASHPSVPFGGIKKSGYGRELSQLGIKEFVNQKTIWVK